MSMATGQEFRVGDVVGQGFSVLLRNIVPFFVISFLVLVISLVFLLVIAFAFGLSALMGAGLEGATPDQTLGVELGVMAIIGIILAVIVFLALQQMGVAAITYGTIQDLRGRKPGIGECLARGLGLMFPTLGVAILTGLACAVGAFGGLLVGVAVPFLGVIVALILMIVIYTILWVAVPVAVVERPGIVASLDRSRALTRGSRLKSFGVLALAVVIMLVANLIATLVFSLLGEAMSQIAGMIVQTLATAFFSCVIAVAYYRLRVAKEGVEIDEIAKVFD
jgi:hypothetical protein